MEEAIKAIYAQNCHTMPKLGAKRHVRSANTVYSVQCTLVKIGQIFHVCQIFHIC